VIFHDLALKCCKFVPLITENKGTPMATDILTQNGQTKSRNFVDNFESPDFYLVDDLLTEEHKLIRSSIRDFVKKEITPFIEDWAERNHFPYERVRKCGEIGAFGPSIPEEYG
jgi:glutaryl-CoA dehydrogenase